MKLVIAEKPSMARAIRDVVGREYEVTNAFGHILELAEPDDYLPDSLPVSPKTGRKIWRDEDLPIIPKVWKQIPKKEAKDQLKKIGDLLKKADLVVNAGDPDREGQLLIDEILEHFGYRGRVERVWLSALDRVSVEKAFRKLEDNRKYRPLRDAAMGRSQADWLVGMNCTRASTLSSGTFYSIGRVQTPTLALVVRRDRTIENFVPRDYFDVLAHVRHEKGAFEARWKPASTDGSGFDEEGRLTDRRLAEAIAAKAIGPGKISRFEKKEQKQQAPLPYNLSALQKAASSRYGLSADEVLKTCQSLYEKKVTTYPRTDCRYLPEEQWGDAARILRSLQLPADLRKNVDPACRHAVWNTAKVTAHHAIIPTGESATDLSDRERKLYDMIRKSYVALFLPEYRFYAISLAVELGGETWTASGRQEIDSGWKDLYEQSSDEEETEDAAPLPDCKLGDPVVGQGGSAIAKQTRPPSRFTDGTLIEAMSNIHKFVEDPVAKKTLKETSGIGTEATRATILETLVKREYIVRKGKQILSTEKGRSLVGFLEATLPDLVDPVTTARWEDSLSEVAEGSRSMDDFVGGIAGLVRSHTGTILTKGRGQLVSGSKTSDRPQVVCPLCGGETSLVRLPSKKKKGLFFWICPNKDASGTPVHPPLSDENGKPGKPFGEVNPSGSKTAKPLSRTGNGRGQANTRGGASHSKRGAR
ncbi:DNA topoisomerase 3 [Leptospirillum ferriphilum]|uniref:DNA topoisomerase 3 n=1 Tax=Leptospirillum ferriphilum TaxID=178606 RepID=UPI0006B1AC0C|nr:DNA topoisomerase 3 [Leptospirillum ferriphilum]